MGKDIGFWLKSLVRRPVRTASLYYRHVKESAHIELHKRGSGAGTLYDAVRIARHAENITQLYGQDYNELNYPYTEEKLQEMREVLSRLASEIESRLTDEQVPHLSKDLQRWKSLSA
jgi:hypothetical protein